MTRRIVSAPEHSAPVVINLPMKTTDLNAHQTAQVSGGRVDGSYIYDILADLISEQFGIDLPPLPDAVIDVHPWSM